VNLENNQEVLKKILLKIEKQFLDDESLPLTGKVEPSHFCGIDLEIIQEAYDLIITDSIFSLKDDHDIGQMLLDTFELDRTIKKAIAYLDDETGRYKHSLVVGADLVYSVSFYIEKKLRNAIATKINIERGFL
jgi:hypothetical protein